MSNKSLSVYTVYEQSYIEKCKVFWYSHGRHGSDKRIHDLLKDNDFKDEHGRIPSPALIGNWRAEYGWDAWADIMDAQANEEVEMDLIANKAKMLKEQAQRGFDLQEMGMKYLKEDGFDSASAAVQGVIRGAELERTSRGIGEMILKMSKMSDADLKDEIIKRLQRATDAGAIDAEEIPQENKDDDTESN